MIISDLNNLETVKGNEVVGGFRNVEKKEKLSLDVRTKFKNKVNSVVKLKGNAANAEADAAAEGKNTLTTTATDVVVMEGVGSASSSLSQAATVGFKKK